MQVEGLGFRFRGWGECLELMLCDRGARFVAIRLPRLLGEDLGMSTYGASHILMGRYIPEHLFKQSVLGV